MQHTTNYNLPQWEATDAVKREDVNGAMSAIDAALGPGYVTLQSYTIPYEMDEISFDMSGIDYSQWRNLHLFTDLTGIGSWNLRINDTDVTMNGVTFNWRSHTTMDVSYNKELSASGIIVGYQSRQTFVTAKIYRAIDTISLVATANYKFQPRGTVVLMGER